MSFWRPSTQHAMKALQPGEPWLCRLKSPVNAIGGVGFFERYSALPAWLAWGEFGRANDLRFRVSRRLRDDYANGKTYYALDGAPIAAPKDPRERPSPEALAWHLESRFLG